LRALIQAGDIWWDYHHPIDMLSGIPSGKSCWLTYLLHQKFYTIMTGKQVLGGEKLLYFFHVLLPYLRVAVGRAVVPMWRNDFEITDTIGSYLFFFSIGYDM
jgi:hypothetical protein